MYQLFINVSSQYLLFFNICCVFVSLLFPHSHPLRICPWALVGWTKADLRHSHLTVTTCPLTGWSVVAPQPLTCRTRWMDRCLVSEPSPWNFPPSLFCPPFFSLSHLGCLATPQKCERGRSTERWCHRFPASVVLDLYSGWWCSFQSSCIVEHSFLS